MEKTCSFCGKKFGLFNAPWDIANSTYAYCDSHWEFKHKLRTLLQDDIELDVSETVTLFQKSLKSVSEEFPFAANALIQETKDNLLREREEKQRSEQRKKEYLEQQKNAKANALQTQQKTVEKQKEIESIAKSLILTTGTAFDGYHVETYIDVICEEIVFKNSLWKRLDAGFEDLGNALSFSDREMTGSSELIANARAYVMNKFKLHAATIGANAILGIDFESSFGSDVVRVSVSGTAVVINKTV